MGHVLQRRYGRALQGGGFKVAYLSAGARRTYVGGVFSLDEAVRQMNRLKRRGLTTWVEDSLGAFVPVPGAKRLPAFNL